MTDACATPGFLHHVIDGIGTYAGGERLIDHGLHGCDLLPPLLVATDQVAHIIAGIAVSACPGLTFDPFLHRFAIGRGADIPHAGEHRFLRLNGRTADHRHFAFAEQLAKAVPLSRQLIEQASQGVDLGSAEGRARMLAQAKPLWQALPQGALRRQLLPELARQAQLDSADLAALWGQRVALARDTGAPLRAPARAAARHAPAGLADQALRLLLAHNDWWDRLSGEDQGLLHGLGGLHGEVLAWLERQLTEHGAQTSAALSGAMHGEAWAAVAQGWLQAVAAAELHHFEDLQRVLQRMWVEALGDEAQALASAEPDAQGLSELRHLRQRIAELKAGLSAHAAAERHGG